MNFKVTSIFLILLAMLLADAARAWEIDWSRRQQKQNSNGAPDSALPTQQSAPAANVAVPPIENSQSQNQAQSQSQFQGQTTTANSAAVSQPVEVNSMNAVAAPGIPETSADVAAPPMNKKYLEGLVQTNHVTYSGDRQEFVILNTGHGFVPSNVRIHKGLHYVVHIVNVNEDKKNVSFMLDAFNQHYATYFGQIKSFNLDPDKEGVFDFQCPETNSTGKLIVFGQGMAPTRFPSSQK